MIETIAKMFCIAAIAALGNAAQALPKSCAEFGGKTFCSSGPKTPLHVFGDCLKERLDAVEKGDEGQSFVSNWLEPASTATACMARKGVTELPTEKRAGVEYCRNRGDLSTREGLRFCKVGGSDDALEVSMSYCRQTAEVFLELKMLQVATSPFGYGAETINLQLIAPCIAAQGWSVKKAPPPKRDPKQRPGEMGSI